MAFVKPAICPMCGNEMIWVMDRSVLAGQGMPRFLCCRSCKAVMEPNENSLWIDGAGEPGGIKPANPQPERKADNARCPEARCKREVYKVM